MFDDAFKGFVIFARPFLNAHNHVAVHLQEAPIRIPGKPLVIRFFRDDLHHFVVHPEI